MTKSTYRRSLVAACLIVVAVAGGAMALDNGSDPRDCPMMTGSTLNGEVVKHGEIGQAGTRYAFRCLDGVGVDL